MLTYKLTSRQKAFYLLVSIVVYIASCESKPVKAPEPEKPKVEVKETKTGLASYYGPGLEGKETFGGEKFDSKQMVAAHPTYPLGTVVRVTNLKTQDTIQVRIADRGPTRKNQKEGIIIDLSKGAAAKLNMIGAGRQKVLVEVLEWGEPMNKTDSAR
jgi:rare lipoprotein A